jgi:mRNA-degrading endonuclease RelE of RelBE toxin-antitoxin system
MKMTFIEMTWFTKRLKSRLEDAEYQAFQQELLVNPELGDVMPGCGGLRKARWAEAGRGKGKRSGVRIIYLAIPEAKRIDLFDIYGKDEKDDLSAQEKGELAAMVKEVKKQAIAAYKRSRGEK